MQRVGQLKEDFLSFGNLYVAYQKAFKATKNQESFMFAYFREKELFALQGNLRLQTYIPQAYRYFTVYEPKEREISSCSFRDRVVHHALINILEPIYERRFIFHSYATRKNKGTHKAIKQAQNFLQKNKWYLKMDIQKYFPSINHEILLRLIDKKIKDKFILELCQNIISKGNREDARKGVGIPIGNLTSQFFANVYLDAFDHFVKDELGVKGYVRYMDDFCFFSNDKSYLKSLQEKVVEFLKVHLELTPKPTATLLNTRLHGLPFLGVRIFPAIIRYKKENFNRSFKKLKKREWEYTTKKIDYEQYICSMQSLLSHLSFYGHHLFKSRYYVKGGFF